MVWAYFASAGCARKSMTISGYSGGYPKRALQVETGVNLKSLSCSRGPSRSCRIYENVTGLRRITSLFFLP
jgi:hypothetical protein